MTVFKDFKSANKFLSTKNKVSKMDFDNTLLKSIKEDSLEVQKLISQEDCLEKIHYRELLLQRKSELFWSLINNTHCPAEVLVLSIYGLMLNNDGYFHQVNFSTTSFKKTAQLFYTKLEEKHDWASEKEEVRYDGIRQEWEDTYLGIKHDEVYNFCKTIASFSKLTTLHFAFVLISNPPLPICEALLATKDDQIYSKILENKNCPLMIYTTILSDSSKSKKYQGIIKQLIEERFAVSA